MAQRKKEINVPNAIENKTLFNGEVVSCSGSEQEEVITVLLKGRNAPPDTRVKITREEADNHFKVGSASYLVGFTVPLVLVSQDEKTGVIYGSRSKAQDILEDVIKEDLLNPEAKFMGQVLCFTRFGAIVAVSGVIGILKHTDLTVDYSKCNEHLMIGDKIEVTCKEYTNDKKIYWSAVKKLHRADPPEIKFSEGDVVVGRIVAIKDFNGNQYAYVEVDSGIEVMAFIPYNVDINLKSKVSIRIQSIEPSSEPYAPPKIKGRIERVC